MIKIDGKQTSLNLFEEIKNFSLIDGIKQEIKAVFIQVGDNPASNLYVKNKLKACIECGFEYELIRLEDSTTEKLIGLINNLNKDNTVHGIMVQLPLPKHIDEKEIRNAILPIKDIDGFNSINLGKAMLGDEDAIIPATPLGISILIDEYGIETKGKHVVVLGRSETVGRPIANILSNNKYNATVTLCNSHTECVEVFTKCADILICAIGKAEYITKDMVKKGVVVIDVGINRNSEGKLCGDCADNVQDVASYMSLVPGGVGPMTVASLMYNLAECASRQLV